MVKSSGESSGMGYLPHVVAEPYGGFWSSPFWEGGGDEGLAMTTMERLINHYLYYKRICPTTASEETTLIDPE